jgi:hypothetical protein
VEKFGFTPFTEGRTLELFVVTTVDTIGDDYLDRAAVDRFVNVKGKTVGYVEASINTPAGPHRYMSASAPLGLVATRDDAERLLEALLAEFPGINFRVDTRQYPDNVDVVWHQVR